MEIIEGSAIKVRTRDPYKVTNSIKKSKVVGEQNGCYEVLTHLDLGNAHILKNLGFRQVPSPILYKYNWPGQYTPFSHQRETASFLTLHRRAFCWNEQGLGKSASVIWAADYLISIGAIRRVLIVAPLSILDCAWRQDLFRVAMHRRVGIAHGTRETRVKVINSSAEFVIINYDGVEIVRDEIATGGFDLIVLDEANAIKSAKTRRWRVLNSLVKPDTWLWLLTGTPASQSPVDAYGLAKIVNPSSVPAYAGAWKDRVMLQISQFRWIPRPEAQDLVHKALQPAIRFTKAQCLDLPEQLITTREVEMTKQQKKYYDLLRKEMLIQVADQDVTAVNAAVEMSKLLQISGGACITSAGKTIEFDCSEKLNETLDIINESPSKTIIFATFRGSIELIEAFLKKNKVSCETIHGGVSGKKRTEIIGDFQTKPDPKVLVIQPQAAAHGITLTAASTIVWFSPTTSVELYLQGNARTHRAGQRNPCLVVNLCSSPVEKKLYGALENRTLAQNDLLALYKNFLSGG